MNEDDTIDFQWFEPALIDYDALGPFQPMWRCAKQLQSQTHSGTTTYAAESPRTPSDTPYTNDVAGGEGVAQRDVILHKFTLTEEGKLPQDVIDACSEHPAIWWTQRLDGRKRIPNTMRRAADRQN